MRTPRGILIHFLAASWATVFSGATARSNPRNDRGGSVGWPLPAGPRRARRRMRPPDCSALRGPAPCPHRPRLRHGGCCSSFTSNGFHGFTGSFCALACLFVRLMHTRMAIGICPCGRSRAHDESMARDLIVHGAGGLQLLKVPPLVTTCKVARSGYASANARGMGLRGPMPRSPKAGPLSRTGNIITTTPGAALHHEDFPRRPAYPTPVANTAAM